MAWALLEGNGVPTESSDASAGRTMGPAGEAGPEKLDGPGLGRYDERAGGPANRPAYHPAYRSVEGPAYRPAGVNVDGREAALERMVRVSVLYDLYGGLLTDRQREFVELHYLKDLSLGEISEQYSISRQAVHDIVARAVATLAGAEERLGLASKDAERQRLLDSIRALTSDAERLLISGSELAAGATSRLRSIVAEIRRILTELE